MLLEQVKQKRDKFWAKTELWNFQLSEYFIYRIVIFVNNGNVKSMLSNLFDVICFTFILYHSKQTPPKLWSTLP